MAFLPARQAGLRASELCSLRCLTPLENSARLLRVMLWGLDPPFPTSQKVASYVKLWRCGLGNVGSENGRERWTASIDEG
jgi:hypothetical protein